MEQQKPTVQDYLKQIENLDCKWCRGRDHEETGLLLIVPLKGQLLEHYDHDGGWPLAGHKELQWLYVTCPNCNYQWSLAKLGIPRYSPEAQAETPLGEQIDSQGETQD